LKKALYCSFIEDCIEEK